jgi:Nucleotidyltransferase
MSEQNLELEAFSKFIIALEPWLGEAVLIGGWAHRLYRLDPRARRLDYPPLTTLDGDVAVPPRLKEQESPIRQRLLEAGFTEESEGEAHPPATHYHYGKGGGFYAEFLAPLVGSEYDRHGKRKVTMEVGGVSSQLLRYIEILLVSPWSVELSEESGFPLSPKRTVRRTCRSRGKFSERTSPHIFTREVWLASKRRLASSSAKSTTRSGKPALWRPGVR